MNQDNDVSDWRAQHRKIEEELARRQEKWDRRWLALARHYATWSKDPSTKVGCVVVSYENRQVSMGYNGFPQGVDDDPELYRDRESKLLRVVHADANAIFSAAREGIALDGATMYLTGPPCQECVKAIIQAGIARVVWPSDNPFERDPDTAARWLGKMAAGFDMMTQADVEQVRVNDVDAVMIIS